MRIFAGDFLVYFRRKISKLPLEFFSDPDDAMTNPLTSYSHDVKPKSTSIF